jgi:uncharacterized membrane protein YeaQ/YmgE (transglycosylase-associated protein family)
MSKTGPDAKLPFFERYLSFWVILCIIAGMIIGLIARILVPTMQSIGCIVTVIIGMIGAFAGLGIAHYFDYAGTWYFVLLTQVSIAVILVAITAGLFWLSGAK